MIMMTIQREGQRFSEVVPEFEESGITEQKRWTEQWRRLSFGKNHPLKSLQWRPLYFEDTIIPWIKTRSTTTMTSCTQARSDPRRPWRRVEWNDINWQGATENFQEKKRSILTEISNQICLYEMIRGQRIMQARIQLNTQRLEEDLMSGGSSWLLRWWWLINDHYVNLTQTTIMV